MSWKVLIANRGEVALRVLRACKALGYETVMVHSQADRLGLAVRLADEHLCIGPAPAPLSYLDPIQILRAAELTGAHAIHPGYGFLSENSLFAEQVCAAGLTFIGPSAEHIRLMGDKHQAIATAQYYGLPTIPGSDGLISDDITKVLEQAQKIGYPLLIKAASGGGGKGIKLVKHPQELIESLPVMQMEAQRCYGNNALYLEKYLVNPRHIEVQILGDGAGGAWHFGLRDCSVQRRHQKVLEEAWPVQLDPEATEALLEKCCHFIRNICYKGLGTLEFLYSQGSFFFIEMNTRLQVEHPITEMICQYDLVMAQLRLFEKNSISLRQSEIQFKGHAIECRINAEDPITFLPSPGKIDFYHAPGGCGIRIDSALYQGAVVPPHYDSLVAKIIAHGQTRLEAIAKLRMALHECVIDGIKTNIPLHLKLLSHEAFIAGGYGTEILQDISSSLYQEVE